MVWLGLLFFITALLYASVGFGGGSTYNALLVLYGVDYRILPAIALICNIIVVTGGTWQFARAGHLSVKRLLPWIVTSIPAAWIGGVLPISEVVFVGVLGFSLLIAGSHLAMGHKHSISKQSESSEPMIVALLAGSGIGFLSGLVGIGGGIFLAPVLYFLRWGTTREIAGACSFFILVNSVSGLGGHLMKFEGTMLASSLLMYWPQFLAVLIGGQIGSRLNINWLSSHVVKRMTAILILYVAVRLLLRWYQMIN